jgi:hypothetical protein
MTDRTAFWLAVAVYAFVTAIVLAGWLAGALSR